MSRSVAAIALLLLASACKRPPDPSDQSESMARTSPEVVLVPRAGAEVRVKVELARTPAEREHGLMYRRSLDGGTGMLFLFPAPDRLKFWMHNTYIPLDMIFLAADRRVIFVEENAEPLTDLPRGPDEPTQFVLEVPGGWSRAHGIEPGVTATFVGVH